MLFDWFKRRDRQTDIRTKLARTVQRKAALKREQEQARYEKERLEARAVKDKAEGGTEGQLRGHFAQLKTLNLRLRGLEEEHAHACLTEATLRKLAEGERDRARRGDGGHRQFESLLNSDRLVEREQFRHEREQEMELMRAFLDEEAGASDARAPEPDFTRFLEVLDEAATIREQKGDLAEVMRKLDEASQPTRDTD